jgi:predicted RNA-binding protein with TRAM domain
MRRPLLLVSLVVLSLVMWAPHATAQDTKMARGTITAMTGNSITVKVDGKDTTFNIDAKTDVTASGAGTATRKAEAAGKPGVTLSEVFKVGENVEVRYHEAGMHATSIRRVRTAGSGGTTASEPSSETINGRVDSVTSSALTVTSDAGGGATAKQTFTIDGTTKVIAHGAGTAAAARGGKVVITDHVGVGDRVTVTFHKTGSTMHAAEIRVREKAKQ